MTMEGAGMGSRVRQRSQVQSDPGPTEVQVMDRAKREPSPHWEPLKTGSCDARVKHSHEGRKGWQVKKGHFKRGSKC